MAGTAKSNSYRGKLTLETRADFSEVGHTGGKVTFKVKSDEAGHVAYQIRWSHSSTSPSAVVGIYAHPDGFACGNIQMGGIGQPWNRPPLSNCIAVMMASDSQGKFGHECSNCQQHFRSESIPSHSPLTCPYCGMRTESYHFLTPPQRSYIRHYVFTLMDTIAAMEPEQESEVVIDMDSIADAVTDQPRPDFYYTSTRQQTEFECAKCANYNDIRGKYGYCSSCGWRNNAASARAACDDLRDRLNQKKLSAEESVKQTVSVFDAAARNYIEQLRAAVPMLESRRKELERLLFHNLQKFDQLLQTFFGINILNGMESDRAFINMMFCRRHLYEHAAGVATDKYVHESGDTEIESGVLIRESDANAHKFTGCLNRMISNLDSGFHEIIPPEPYCIELEAKRQRLIKSN